MLFLKVWEQLNNPDFNSPEFEGIRNEAGRISFFLSAKKWIAATGAIGIYSMYGDLQGIAGKSLQEIDRLELSVLEDGTGSREAL